MQENTGEKNKDKRSATNLGAQSHVEISMNMKRQDSFIHNMTIFGGAGFFERMPSEQKEILPVHVEPAISSSREERHGNVFSGFRSEEAPKIHEVRNSSSHNYQRECLEYEKYLFDNRIRMIIKRMAIKAYSIFKAEKESQFFVFPIQKLLVGIAKKLLLNRFELLFLQYAFEETKWRYDIECIRKHSVHFKSYIMLPDSEVSNVDVKLMEVYILYCAYFAKKSLNELPHDNAFLGFCQEVCPKFKDFFPEWTQSSGTGVKINPKQLNAIFKRLTYNFGHEHEEMENYCLVVEEIIDISPAYNPDKSNKQKKIKKSKKAESRKKEEESESEGEIENMGNINNYGNHHGYNHNSSIIQEEELIGTDPFPSLMLRSKKSSILSVDMLDPAHYLNRSLSEHERR